MSKEKRHFQALVIPHPAHEMPVRNLIGHPIPTTLKKLYIKIIGNPNLTNSLIYIFFI
ncbi:hypothetical protein [Clostridium sp. SHJSY1]|uniref:hypothetical protein n=1 Tax=Clostridium sp. SHJSY1 TaxID=2942483 RepID=UPI00287B67CE|nr:hypothetical protein [Clostridium sp. SHJSY1]